METGTCDSCGRDGEALEPVVRIYVTPESWGDPGRVEKAGRERWCFACRTHYPHTTDEVRRRPG
jgi:hypothetical protein